MDTLFGKHRAIAFRHLAALRLTMAGITMLLACGCQKSGHPGGLPQPIQRQQVAFNAQDVEAMGNGVADDFVWYNVSAGNLTVEVEGRVALMSGMSTYFASLASVRSEIESFSQNGNQVAVVERVTWSDSTGTQRSQAAIAVYQLEGPVIAQVWYFPHGP